MSTFEPRIRTSTAADLPRLVEIDALAARGDLGRRHLLKSSIDDGLCLVLDTESGVIGYIITATAAFFGRDFIELLMVDGRHRRTGAGRSLLRAAVDAATTSKVFTSTNESNRAMRNLLESEDWQFSGRLDGLDEGDPELVFFRSPTY